MAGTRVLTAAVLLTLGVACDESSTALQSSMQASPVGDARAMLVTLPGQYDGMAGILQGLAFAADTDATRTLLVLEGRGPYESEISSVSIPGSLGGIIVSKSIEREPDTRRLEFTSGCLGDMLDEARTVFGIDYTISANRTVVFVREPNAVRNMTGASPTQDELSHPLDKPLVLEDRTRDMTYLDALRAMAARYGLNTGLREGMGPDEVNFLCDCNTAQVWRGSPEPATVRDLLASFLLAARDCIESKQTVARRVNFRVEAHRLSGDEQAKWMIFAF